MKKHRFTIGRNAIKESFDNLSTGMCYFDQSGLPILVNHKMDQLVFALIGRDLQYEAELSDAIAGLKDRIFFAENGHVWKFDCKQIFGIGTEYIAADITTIYQDNQLLQEKNNQLQELNDAIEEIGRNYVTIAREEEILSMKMRIHSEMGKCGLDIQKYYQDGCRREQKKALIQKLQKAVAMLKGEVGKTDEEDSIVELMRTADAIGAKIQITGSVPQETSVMNLMVLSMRECLMNNIRHAGGDTVFVTFEEAEEYYRAEIKNNGQAPETEITEGGGLSSLRQKIERAGGDMSVVSVPLFCLNVQIPKNCGGGTHK